MNIEILNGIQLGFYRVSEASRTRICKRAERARSGGGGGGVMHRRPAAPAPPRYTPTLFILVPSRAARDSRTRDAHQHGRPASGE
ncbi:hypothetical protein JYU34_002252 [Plutella xylostella]|uniref:Uncharacterized protein n=1 Tax=Plutella xylostella TaxID=51655 RepID=A0ABQ7R1R1_PLUXY|nr:hypothetical protein JYU34_002252 [Plutella xylostella]